MPRPRKLEKGSVTSVFLPESLKKALEAEAVKRGKKVSELIREALTSYLSLQSSSPSDPPSTDPLDEMEWGDFLRAVDKLEREVDRYLELTRRFGRREEGQPLILFSGGRREEVHMPSVNKLFSRWNALKRWYKSLGRREYEVSRRLVEIHEKIREYGELRGELPPEG
ncbi:MAG: ribbon-helix-helix protein, CopG family [Thermofilaceae archaeon]